MQDDPHSTKKMSDYELEKWTGGFKPGHAAFKRILRVIEEIQRKAPKFGEAVH